jgi:hypothetical protein
MILMQRSFGGGSAEKVAQFERAHGLNLPADYREFLVQHNGGAPALTRFRIPAVGQDALVHCFFGLGTREGYDLVQPLGTYRAEMPAQFLPIASDPGGAFILLGCEGAEDQGVFFWDHTCFFRESCDEENTYRIGESFRSFVSSLLPEQA